MALGWLGDWFADFNSSGNLTQSLALLATSRAPVRIEIEKTLIWFNSRVAVPPGGKVVLEKPQRINGELSAGSVVRLRIPGNHKVDMRLEVSVPHYNLPNGGTAFICKLPEELRACRRRSERHPAVQYKNLFLQIGNEKFKVVDISATGLKYHMPPGRGPANFSIDKDLAPALLVLGQSASVQLARIVPRNHHGGMAGCEIKVAQDTASQKHFKQILEVIQAAESERAHT